MLPQLKLPMLLLENSVMSHLLFLSMNLVIYLVSTGNSGSMAGPHAMQTRSVPRQMPMVGMQRMQPPGIPTYNLASQAGMGGVNPGGIPMQRGAAQAHQQQQVYMMRRKDPGMGMSGYPPQQKRRF
ncbi:hypothetical protein RD792_001326 [Penstemon davidsonii]|uniref:Uncharacterized protein n=1 Tax=Penstemon davidsonii TaxID=160366 RepID=A0ABR0DN35_9LAMI|nr:hypothetical protein RD792_001326 [Penstemon davidsonii]